MARSTRTAIQRKSLETQVLKLAVRERAKLAQVLWKSIGDGPPDSDERQALEESKRRDAEMDSGKVAGRTHAEVMRAARRALK